MSVIVLPSGAKVGRGLKQKDPATALVSLALTPVTEHAPIMKALKALSGQADLTAFVKRILNQGLSETCWAHSATALKFVVDMIRSGKADMVSPLFFAKIMYALYRDAQTPAGMPLPGPGLEDQGAQLDDARDAFARFGSVPFGKPEQDGNTDVPATQDDDGDPILLPELTVPEAETGITVPFGGSYDIATGAGAGDLVAASLEAKRPVWFGTLVGQAFQALVAGDIAQPCDPSDPTAGGHAMGYLAYKTVSVNGTKKRQYKVLNSWGADWCEGGYVWASEEFVEANWSALPFEDNAP